MTGCSSQIYACPLLHTASSLAGMPKGGWTKAWRFTQPCSSCEPPERLPLIANVWLNMPSGIWTKDLKFKTNLQQPQITKILKNLEQRSLVKSVKSVSNASRKVYMLFELDPAKEITGGAWCVSRMRLHGMLTAQALHVLNSSKHAHYFSIFYFRLCAIAQHMVPHNLVCFSFGRSSSTQ